ncbi:helix-turn-helix transcriptional regulator [Nisaea nitritireducens]|uniref:helix-turn-helix transcriptional regulator n=1 Tax=Nisaea nitritireducens TaxID=568392 RepID=UPI0018663815|nr:hypothetical protein [Nisaea nitritireducens]
MTRSTARQNHSPTVRLLVAPIVREQLSAKEAAAMCGESEGTFRKLVAEGYYPKPVPRPRRSQRWNRQALQNRLDEIRGVRNAADANVNMDAEFGIGS